MITRIVIALESIAESLRKIVKHNGEIKEMQCLQGIKAEQEVEKLRVQFMGLFGLNNRPEMIDLTTTKGDQNL
jgi:hypothetical protein